MKHYLYIDNFRGFSNTRIPITQVNFLVGQNSTGKTSVLGLMKLLSGPHFFLSGRHGFADEPVNFGDFSDIVSAHSARQDYFRIGAVFELPPRRRSHNAAAGYLLTFVKDDEGVPHLSRSTFYGGRSKISLAFPKNGSIYYQTSRLLGSTTVDEILDTLLPKWVDEHSREKPTRYSKLEIPIDLPQGRPPLYLAMTMAWDISKGTFGKIKTEFDFPVNIFTPPLTWVAPIRTKPKRTYDESPPDYSPEGEHTPYMIRRMLKSKSMAKRFTAFIKDVGKQSGLFQDVRIKSYGPTRFEVDVILDRKPLNIRNVGYGVSQSLPVLTELIARGHGSWFGIQQPEVHLHPRAQATLGDIFFQLAALDHKLFLIETHSDFMIDRFRMNYQKTRKFTPDSQILFFERRDKHNIVTSLPINKDGQLPKDQPDSYREFFIREELRLLQL